MQTERLQQHALRWLKDRPTLAREQLQTPQFPLRRMIDEVYELLAALEEGDGESILDEWTDVANFFASAEAVMETMGISAQQVLEHSRYKYGIRNELKYGGDYDDGDPHEQLRKDANMWSFYQAYLGIAEVGLGNEYY